MCPSQSTVINIIKYTNRADGFLTFAEAKVVAPPILQRKYRAHTVQIIIMMSHQMTQHFKSGP